MNIAIPNPKRITDLTTDEEPLRMGIAVHHDINDTMFDMHYELELGIVCAGGFERYFPDRKIAYQAGQIWLHGIWEPHGFNLHSVPCKVIVIIFRPEIFKSIRLWNKNGMDWLSPFFNQPQNRPQVPDDKIPLVLDIAKKMEAFQLHDLKYNAVRIQLFLLELLLLLKDNGTTTDSNALAHWETLSEIQPALQLLYSTKGFISESDAAKACNLSKSKFSKAFQVAMNATFSKFALRFRIKNAETTLANTNIPIIEISEQEGFSDISHFYRCFKQFYHCSPMEYRKNYLKK